MRPFSAHVAPAVVVETAGPATWIRLDRPEVKNAINLDALRELIAAIQGSHTDASSVVVLTGNGGSFSSGGDIKDMVERRGQAIVTFDRIKHGLAQIAELLFAHPKPVIARVDGDCLGAGCGLALACDFLLATETSRFGFPFVKVGLVPDTGTSWMVPHMVGVQQARRLLLTGDMLTASEAAQLGLVTQVVPDSASLNRAVSEWVQKLAALPPTAYRDAKRLLWSSIHQPLGTAVFHEALLQGVRFTTDEHAKAVDEFLARKRA